MSAAVAAVLVSSCSVSPIQDEMLELQPELGTRTITATVSVESNDDTSDTKISSDFGSDSWAFSWEEDDVIYAIDDLRNITQLTKGVNNANGDPTFSGEISQDAATIRFIYTGDAGQPSFIYADPTDESDKYKINADMQEQDGTLNKFYMISDIIDVDNWERTDFTPTLKHIGSFLEFNFDFTNLIEGWGDIELEKAVFFGSMPYVSVFYADKDVSDEGFHSAYVSQKVEVDLKDNIAVTADGIATVRFSIAPESIGSQLDGGNYGVDIDLYFSNGTKVSFVKDFGSSSQVSINRAEFKTTKMECDFVAANTADNISYIFADDSGDELLYGETLDDTYYIASETNLRALAALANSSKLSGTATGETASNTFTLSGDIEITSDKNWVPIGYASTAPFAGIFDGVGSKITGMNCVAQADADVVDGDNPFISIGLFGYVSEENTVVKNFVLDDCYSEMNDAGCHTALVAGTLLEGATILNCGVNANCTAVMAANGAIGSLVGMYGANGGSILNSFNQGTVKSTSTLSTVNIGGLCGSSAASLKDLAFITNCYNSGSVILEGSPTTYNLGAIIGGFLGQATYTGIYYLTDCAGENVLAAGATSSSVGSNPVNVSSLSDDLMKASAGGTGCLIDLLNTGESSITDAVDWTKTEGDYPILNFSPRVD